MATYIALLRKDADSDYGVDFPDFPGCITAGSTLEEARIMAVEALTLHIDGMLEDGVPIPGPASLDTIMADPDNAGAIAFLVTLPDRAGKPVRFNASFPEDLLNEVDRAARQRGLTRSGFLAKAAKREIQAA